MAQCRVCGGYVTGSTTTCKECEANGLKWCRSCHKILPMSSFAVVQYGIRARCNDCCEASRPKKNKAGLIDTTLKRKKVNKSCKTCYYSFTGSFCGVICQYILIEGKRRGCSAENCDKYKPKKKYIMKGV